MLFFDLIKPSPPAPLPLGEGSKVKNHRLVNNRVRVIGHWLLVIIWLLVIGYWSFAFAQEVPRFTITFYPQPATIGKPMGIAVKIPYEAQEITMVFREKDKISLSKIGDFWSGVYFLPGELPEGEHFASIYIKYLKAEIARRTLIERFLNFFRTFFGFRVITYQKEILVEGKVKYLAAEERKVPEIVMPPLPLSPPPAPEAVPLVTPEAVLSPEAFPLTIKGTKITAFTSRSLEGTKEGYVPGVTREESLRLSIAGKVQEAEVEANFISTSTLGTTIAGEREDKVSAAIRYASTEAYFGDFLANIEDVEFAKLSRPLSGVRITGNYEKFGFKAIATSARGQSKTFKSYGDGTQGPYPLGFAPVVIDSERVYVDGVLQKRGDDYEIDYQAGTVTFKKKVILNISIIQVDFEYRQTIYQHSTYGFRASGKAYDWLRLGATYVNDSDSLAGAAETKAAQPTAPDPQSHWVAGMDGSLKFGELLQADSELAFMDRNLNLLAEGSREAGRAAKVSTTSILGPWSLTTKLKRIGPKFTSIGDANPKQDLWESGGVLSFRPGEIFLSEGTYEQQRYKQAGVAYAVTNTLGKARLSPKNLPSLAYFFSEEDTSNDFVTGQSVDRSTIKNSGEMNYQVGFFSSMIKGGIERRINRIPSLEATVYKTLSYGLSTVGLEKITATGNVELKETEEPSGAKPITRTYNLNLSAAPAKEYLLTTTVHIIDDSAAGITNVTDLTYKAEPTPPFKSEGKYTITSVKEDFGATPEAVTKNVGSIRFDLKPTPALRFKYLFKPNFTLVRRTNSLSYNNRTDEYELNWAPFRELSTGLTYRLGSSLTIDKTDYPDLKREKDRSDTKTTLITLKMAPHRIISNELNYLVEDILGSTLSSDAVSYLKTSGSTKKFDAILRTSLAERISVDTTYTFEKVDQLSDISTSNILTQTHTASIKGLWDINENWSVSASSAYSRKLDLLATASPETYTFSPGAGFIFRWGRELRVDANYTFSKSYAGATTEKYKWSLQGRYDMYENVHLTLRFEQEISHAPDYKSTDFMGNLEITL